MASLIANAQINLLYTEQATGLKLKLLNVLYNGRHCIVNPKMVEGTSLGRICLVEQNITELKKLIQTTFKTEITEEDVEVRNILLSREYSNEVSFQKMMLELKLL